MDNEFDLKLKNCQVLPMSVLEPNDGQIPGLPANPREINQEKFELLKKNVKEHPQLLLSRGLLVFPYRDTGHYVIIGGNQRFRAMSEVGYKTAPCEILPAETTVEELKAYTILDNNGFGKWDWDMLANDWDTDELENWGLDLWADDNSGEPDGNNKGEATNDENPYTQKIGSIIYEPSGPKPEISELVDKSYSSKLLDRIKVANIPDDIKDFLRDAAYRHNRFDYEKIANFYAQSDKEVQNSWRIVHLSSLTSIKP